MDIRYRTESFLGTGERDIVDVMWFETFELGNVDILRTLQEGVLKDNQICEEFERIIEYLQGDSDSIAYSTEEEQKEFFQNIVKEINKVTGYDLKYCLWLANKETVLETDGGYGAYIETEADIDAYKVGPVVLSELGYDGTLYGYEKYPEPLDMEQFTELLVRPLTVHDLKQVEVMDEMSGNGVSQWVCDLAEGELNDYSWGMFFGDEMIGYCTIGGADDVCDEIEEYPGYNYNSLLLSDVYIKPEYRGNGYGLKMVDEAIKKRTENEKELVFITLLHDGLSRFYEKIGFQWCYEEEYLMVRNERGKEKMKQYDTIEMITQLACSVRSEMVELYGDNLFGKCIEASDKIVQRINSQLDIDTIIVEGWCQYDDENYGSDRPWDEHTWVEVPSLNLYIDVTADQFNYGMYSENNYDAIIVRKGLPHGMRYNEPIWEEYEENSLDCDMFGLTEKSLEERLLTFREWQNQINVEDNPVIRNSRITTSDIQK